MLSRTRHSLLVILLFTALAAPAPVSASTTVERTTVFQLALSCGGETVELTGSLVFVSTFVELKNGGFVFNFHFISHGTGISASGGEYRWTSTSQTAQIRSPGGVRASTFPLHFQLRGPDGTRAVRFITHFTALPSGELVAEVLNSGEACR